MYSVNELREIVNEIVTEYPVSKVMLVGSYARNTATELSDVDLVIDGTDIGDVYWDILFTFEDSLSVPVDIMTMRGLKNSLIKESVMEGGITLYEA